MEIQWKPKWKPKLCLEWLFQHAQNTNLSEIQLNDRMLGGVNTYERHILLAGMSRSSLIQNDSQHGRYEVIYS